jgi:hypothetical protein
VTDDTEADRIDPRDERKRARVTGARRKTLSGEEDDLIDLETFLFVAWPAPNDPPPRTVRLPGLRISCWPQVDGSVLYEIKYRDAPFEKKKKPGTVRDTMQMSFRSGDGAGGKK